MQDGKKPRTKPPEIRREELMAAAQGLFLDKGFANTSVADIVSAAGVAKGTFYLYFETKDDVLSSLRDRFVDGFCRDLDAADAAMPDDAHFLKLSAWIAGCITAYLENVALHDLVFHQIQANWRDMNKANPVIERLAAILVRGRNDNLFAIDDEWLTAIMLFNAMHGAVDGTIAAGQAFDRNDLIGKVSRLCCKAVIAG